MTTVVWTGEELYSDRFVNYYGASVLQTKMKVHYDPDTFTCHVMAGAGDVADISLIMDWYAAGGDHYAYPHDRIRDTNSCVLVSVCQIAMDTGTARSGPYNKALFIDSGFPIDITKNQLAVGTGAKSALTIFAYQKALDDEMPNMTSVFQAISKVDNNTSETFDSGKEMIQAFFDANIIRLSEDYQALKKRHRSKK